MLDGNLQAGRGQKVAMLLVVPTPLVLAAFCACSLPAHRAASVDPNIALRHL